MMKWIYLAYDRIQIWALEHSTEPSSCIKGRELLDKRTEYYLLKDWTLIHGVRSLLRKISDDAVSKLGWRLREGLKSLRRQRLFLPVRVRHRKAGISDKVFIKSREIKCWVDTC